MATDLNNLLEVSDRIIKNLNAINDIPTSELETHIEKINQGLVEQDALLKKVSVQHPAGQTNKAIDTNISQQQNLINSYGLSVNKSSKISDGVLKTATKTEMFTNKTVKYEGQTIKNNKKLLQQAVTETKISTAGSRTAGDMGAAGEYMAMKNWKTIAKGVGGGLARYGGKIPIIGFIAQWIGSGIEVMAEAAEALVNAAVEVSGMANDFGDKLQDISAKTDEALRSTVQELGLITDQNFGSKTQADQIKKNILVASSYMVNKVGIAFGPEQIAEFQKAYADISKSTLAFHETDYVTMGEVQKVLNLSAQESAELANMFIDMGSNVSDVEKFIGSLMDVSNQSGVNSKHLIKDMKEYFKSTELFKLGNSLQDMSRIMAYAKRIKVDMAGMLKLMDSVSEPEAAVDLAAQLQALDTVFLGLNPIDMMGAAMGDVEEFMKMVTDPMRDNIDKFFNIREGQLTQYGRNFSKGLLNIKGIDQVFKSQQEIVDFFAKSAKEKDIRNALTNSIDLYSNFLTLTPEEQDMLIGSLSANLSGQSLEGTIATLNNKTLKDLNLSDFKTLLKPDIKASSVEEAAIGTVSVKDKLDLNEKIVESLSWTADVINEVNTALRSDDYKKTLEMVSNSIMDVGREVFSDTNFRNLHILHSNLKLSVSEAYLFGEYLVKNTETGVNMLSQALMGAMYVVANPSSVLDWFSGDETPATTPAPGPSVTPESKSVGGLIDTRSVSIPRQSLQAASKYVTSGSDTSKLSDLLSSFITNKFGPGVMTQMGLGGTTKIVVSGEIRNIINERDAGALDGDKVLKILEKQIVQ
jgi:hypothetical protein